jgi:hypothetical protein
MKTRRLGASSLIAVILIGAAATTSCRSSRQTLGNQAEPDLSAESSKKSQQQVQSELMAFADRFFAASLESAKTLEAAQQSPEGRYTAAGARLVGLVVTTDIAASPNPAGALLDMTVFVTLKRMVWEAYWMPEVYGEAGQPVLDTLRELEADIWQIAAGVYTEDQLDKLRAVIDDWKAAHPDAVAVDFVRLSELGDSREAQTLVEAGRSGGMLAPVKEANRNLEEMRLLAERLAFMATRMQLMISLQVEMASAKLATQPEARQLLEDSRIFTDATDRATEAFAELVADLPGERIAAIDQILAGLSEERERIFADLGNENGELRPALRDLHETLETGRQMAEQVDAAARDIDTLVARMFAGNPNAPRPFDILELQATFAELTTTAQELQTTLDKVERLLGSGDIERQIDPIIDGANRLEDEVVNEIIDRAFLRGVALIVIFFVALFLYRWLTRRVAPGAGAAGGPDS